MKTRLVFLGQIWLATWLFGVAGYGAAVDDVVEELSAWHEWMPLLLTLIIAGVVVGLTNTAMARHGARRGVNISFARQLVSIVLLALSLVVVILALPIKDNTRDQLFGLVGLVTTAMIALSSTTFVGNAMAGLMLRSIGSFKAGDFVRINNHFGRVTERALFHTEIQTDARDLTSLPNLYLVTNAVTVVRNSGTVISATVSLGYDVSHREVEKVLKEAAEATGLEDSFVLVEDLGDFSVNYKVAGFLKEVTKLVSARSLLRASVLDALHAANVEIMSPNVVAQRPLGDVRLVPRKYSPAEKQAPKCVETAPEDVIFDKAERAAELERLEAERAQLVAEMEESKKAEGAEKGQEDSPVVRQRKVRISAIERKLELMKQKMETKD